MAATAKDTTKKPATRTKNKGVVKKESTELAASTDMSMFEEDTGRGQEAIGAEDLTIPRIAILQSMSAPCQKGDPAYIKGAEAGFIMNSITRAIIDGEDGVYLIPIKYKRSYIEWIHIDNGGGLVADHGLEIKSEWVDDDMGGFYIPGTGVPSKKDKNVEEKQNQVVNTAEYFCYIVDIKTGEYTPIVISMSKSQFKKAKRWNTMINQLQIKGAKGMFNPAMFYKAYKLTTVPESRDSFNWFGWEIGAGVDTVSLPDGMEIYKSARSFLEQIDKGAVKVAAHESDVSQKAGKVDDSEPM